MPSGVARELGRLAQAALAVALLAGCPQLLDDRFDVFHAENTKDYLPDDVELPDASADPLEGSGGASSAGASSLPDPPPPADGGAAGGVGAAGSAQQVEIPWSADAAVPPADGGSLESDGGGAEPDPVAVALHSSLVHRYRFNAGATLTDSVGAANATSFGVTFAAGAAVFAGTGTGQYLDLPNDLLSGLTNTSIEAWVIWDVTDPVATTSEWQRIFDFGSNSSSVEGAQGSNANGIYLSPKSGGPQGKIHLEYRNSGNTNLDAPERLPTGVVVQLVAVVDHDGRVLSLYQDGSLIGSLGATLDLSTIVYRNNWLGRSQYTENAPFKGRILDFRVYSSALTSPLVQASFAAGADANW